MSQEQAIDLLNRLMWEVVTVSGPLLAAVLAVGLAISVLQATTQLQEMTLSYIPKMLAAALLLIFLGPWMIGRLTQFALAMIRIIPSLS